MLDLTEVSGHCLEDELGTAGGVHELATLRNRKKPSVVGWVICKRVAAHQSPQMSFSPNCLCPTM